MPDSSYAGRAESFFTDLMREQYRVGAGQKPNLDLVTLYRQYADLFAEPSVRERIAALNDLSASGAGAASAPEASEHKSNQDVVAQRTRLKASRYLADFATGNYIESAVKEQSEEITNAELQATIEWDGEQIAYHNVRSLLVREPDFRRRHELHARQLAVTDRQNARRVDRIKRQHQVARDLGFASYRRMIQDLRNWDLDILARALKPLVEETDALFEEKLGRLLSAARVPRNQADTSDVAYVLNAPEFDTYFPQARLVPAFEKTVAALGLAVDSTPGLKLDTAPLPLKSPRAFCAPVRIPDEVYLVIKPTGGQNDYQSFFHEAGHAEHFTHVAATVPFVFRCLGEDAITETYAFLFEHITSSPRWLVDTLRMPLREAERYRRFALFSKLWLVRRFVAKLRYELVLHDEGPQGMETAYCDLLGEVLHLPIPPQRYLDDVDDAFYVAAYLRAWIFERQLSAYLQDNLGEGWYESRDTGGFLQGLWAIGQRDPVDELARERIGAKGLDPMPLIAELAEG